MVRALWEALSQKLLSEDDAAATDVEGAFDDDVHFAWAAASWTYAIGIAKIAQISLSLSWTPGADDAIDGCGCCWGTIEKFDEDIEDDEASEVDTEAAVADDEDDEDVVIPEDEGLCCICWKRSRGTHKKMEKDTWVNETGQRR